ncbi:MAG: DNA alkylation repair protein [Longimicrobiales bacterium]
MAERLKDRFFTPESAASFAGAIKKHHPPFDRARFVGLVSDDSFQALELMGMARRATEILAELLPTPYAEAVEILKRAAPEAKGMEAFSVPTFVELYGLDDWETSLPAMAWFTKYVSAEFAIRPFILKDPARAMAFLEGLTGDDDPNVRRFASEGCRPRLPWAVSLPPFKEDPSPILPILEKLKDDESEFVQRSVANNLNDISKDHPDLVLDVCERWKGSSKSADWIIKRACRTLLKSGDRRAMRLFGFGDPASLEVVDVGMSKKTVGIGGEAQLSFTLRVKSRGRCKVRLEYVVWYVKASGKTSGKVFQIREATLAPGDHEFTRKLTFADQSTRKHYPGEHRISLVINGEEKGETALTLT